MSTHALGTSVKHSIVVEAPIARAFEVFTVITEAQQR